MTCNTSAGSHKHRFLVIVKSKISRSFKGTWGENLPVDYFSLLRWAHRFSRIAWRDFCVCSHLDWKNLPNKFNRKIDNAVSLPAINGLKNSDGQIFKSYMYMYVFYYIPSH